ncbi:hypothetical protein [Novosphingobium sp. ST904]|uniref:hypothetical protein n=1 Tax=Novosphingobium sp. ST904 TaxID=1684385 RepID=UPI0006C8E00D|nr:hypothetical protein [Novosphingobium sp. ST904]TCM32317.1 hypothetical protein EDF59_12411 [Novosphingobium sp. ST904]
MTSTPANDKGGAVAYDPSMIDMSVLDLAIFLRVHRTNRPSLSGQIAATIAHWFLCEVDPREIEHRSRQLIDRGWMVRQDGGMRATVEGRRHSRLHLRGIVRMMDQGTRMLDVARMMSVLQLAMVELDGDHDVDDDNA